MTVVEALSWIANIFEQPLENITPEALRIDIETWDSLGTLTLMAGLDADFGILLTDEELQSLKSVNDILDVMRRNGKLD